MKLSLTTILFVFAPAALAGNVVDDVCKGVQDIWNCKATFDLPTGAKAKMCRNKFFKTDPCKTKTEYRYPCPTWRKPLRTCPGWTCVPGTHETWIDTPCGIEISTKRVDLCQSVRGALGNPGKQFIEKSAAMCKCLPKALEMVGSAAYDSVKSGSDLSGAVSNVLGQLVELQKCMIDNGFNVKDNKAQVLANDLSSTGGWVVVQAKEIDLATYGKLAVALSPCFVGTCNPELIRGFFTNYLTASNELMAQTLNQVLRSWVDVFKRIEDRIAGVADAAGQLVVRIEAVPGNLKKIEDRVCKEQACLGQAATRYLQTVSQAVAGVKALAQVQKDVRMAAEVAPKLTQLANSAVGLVGAVPNVDELIQLIVSGKLRKIQDILESVQVVKKLPELANQIQDSAAPILNLAALFDKDGAQALALLQEALTQSLDGVRAELNDDAAQAGILEMQTLLREELEVPLRNVTESVNQLKQVFNGGGVPIRSGQFKFKAGVSSYRRWSTVSMDLPCTRKKTAHYTVAGGFKGSFDYPEFYACPSGNIEIPWPNHHIPYFKFNLS